MKETSRPIPRRQFGWRLPLSSWGGSIVFHLGVLLFFLLLLQAAPIPKQAPGEKNGMAGIMSVDGETFSDAEHRFTESEGTLLRNAMPANPLEETYDTQFAEKSLREALSIETISPVSGNHALTGNLSANEFSAAPGIGTSRSGAGQEGTGKTRITFFNTEGTARQFVFIIDRSRSMKDNGERPFRAAKEELTQAIGLLNDTNRFNIIFYNERYDSLFETLQAATESNRKKAFRFIGEMPALGATQHLGPILRALRQGPEVIFFLTDGEENDRLTNGQLDLIERTNGHSKHSAQINVIQFGLGMEPQGMTYLKRLAARNNGQYRFINTAR